jgi:hypothetical protein
MKKIPNIPHGGFTSYHYFEFENGTVTMRKTLEDPKPYTHEYIPPDRVASVRDSLLRALFGTIEWEGKNIEDVLLGNGNALSIQETKELSDNRVAALQLIYCHIPEEYLSYYPKEIDVFCYPPEIKSAEEFAMIRASSAMHRKLKYRVLNHEAKKRKAALPIGASGLKDNTTIIYWMINKINSEVSTH